MKWSALFPLKNISFIKFLGEYKWILVVVLVGLVLLFLPSGKERGSAEEMVQASDSLSFDLNEIEKKFSDALSEVNGAGEVTVVLSVKTGAKQILAEQNEYSEKENGLEEVKTPVVLSKGGGAEDTEKLQEIYAQFQGALVICVGGDDPEVRLKLIEATAALTGLGSDKISICSRGK